MNFSTWMSGVQQRTESALEAALPAAAPAISPIARRMADEVLSLPVHPAVTTADVQTIIDAVRTFAPAAPPPPVAARPGA